jgi:hypothetical protein
MDLMQTDPEVRNTMNACMADMKLLIEKEIWEKKLDFIKQKLTRIEHPYNIF